MHRITQKKKLGCSITINLFKNHQVARRGFFDPLKNVCNLLIVHSFEYLTISKNSQKSKKSYLQLIESFLKMTRAACQMSVFDPFWGNLHSLHSRAQLDLCRFKRCVIQCFHGLNAASYRFALLHRVSVSSLYIKKTINRENFPRLRSLYAMGVVQLCTPDQRSQL